MSISALATAAVTPPAAPLTRTYQVPVTVTGSGTGQVRLFFVDPVTFKVTERVATVRPGDRAVAAFLAVTGNTVFGEDRDYKVFAKAVRGTVVGDYRWRLVDLSVRSGGTTMDAA